MLCELCEIKVCLKTGRPCEEVESYLRSQGIYSDKYIRKRREIPTQDIEKIYNEQEYIKKYGKKKKREPTY
jgi:hypothetical protein